MKGMIFRKKEGREEDKVDIMYFFGGKERLMLEEVRNLVDEE